MLTLEWLEEFYCTAIKENAPQGKLVVIDTVSNPGWMVDVQLSSISFQNILFKQSIECSEHNWMFIKVQNRKIKASGDARNLDLMINVIRHLLKTLNTSQHIPDYLNMSSLEQKRDPLLTWLQEYYMICCNEDWEHEYGITIQTEKDQGWYVKIDLNDLNLEEVYFKPVCVRHNVGDWVECEVNDKKFIGRGGPRNLREIIQNFQQWVEDFCTSDAQE